MSTPDGREWVQEAIVPTCELFPAARAGIPPLVLHT
jgi:hypothetical protein